jgi:hypothetical protein
VNPQSVKSQSHRQSVDSRWPFCQRQEQTKAFRRLSGSGRRSRRGGKRQDGADVDVKTQKKSAEEQAGEAPEGRKVSFLSLFQEKTQENAELSAEAPLGMLMATAI